MYSYKHVFKLINWLIVIAKAQELRREIDILSQTFERIVDRKDAVIKSLKTDLDEADEQWAFISNPN